MSLPAQAASDLLEPNPQAQGAEPAILTAMQFSGAHQPSYDVEVSDAIDRDIKRKIKARDKQQSVDRERAGGTFVEGPGQIPRSDTDPTEKREDEGSSNKGKPKKSIRHIQQTYLQTQAKVRVWWARSFFFHLEDMVKERLALLVVHEEDMPCFDGSKSKRPNSWARLGWHNPIGMTAYHATSWQSIVAITNDDRIVPGPRQDANKYDDREKFPCAFAGREPQNCAAYAGPICIRFGEAEVSLAILLECFSPNASNARGRNDYEQAPYWTPAALLIKVWGLSEKSWGEVYNETSQFDRDFGSVSFTSDLICKSKRRYDESNARAIEYDSRIGIKETEAAASSSSTQQTLVPIPLYRPMGIQPRWDRIDRGKLGIATWHKSCMLQTMVRAVIFDLRDVLDTQQ